MIDTRFLFVAISVAFSSLPAFAQEEEEQQLGWTNVADLSIVVTTGNSSTSTFAVDDKLGRKWTSSELGFRFGLLRTQTTDERFAVGTPDDFDVIEDLTRELDNERYHVSGQYQRNVSFNFFWLAGGGSAEAFKFGPVLGDYIAHRVLNDDREPELADGFRLKDAEFDSA